MATDPRKLAEACPEVGEAFIQGHVSRLTERYFKSFSQKEICRHLQALVLLEPERPVELLTVRRKDGSVDCTILGFDYPSVFSLITGLLAGMGFSIISGEIYTYGHVVSRKGRARARRRPGKHTTSRDPLKRRRIIDHFSGRISEAFTFKEWTSTFREKLQEVFSLMEKGGEQPVTRAKQQVNEMVVSRLAHLHRDATPVLFPLKIELDNKTSEFTSVKVISEDTPAFLYALSNALSLLGISIEQVRIRTIHGRIEDQLYLADLQGNKIQDERTLNKIRFSVLLTKQFTYFLAQAPDPFMALARFEYLVDDVMKLPQQGKWMDMLTDPRYLQGLARLLGASDFLWEDFIRLQYESLLPMLKPHLEGESFSEPVETMGARLTQALDGKDALEEKREALNAFKDREIFLIDLGHILDPRVDFLTLSNKLTRLAENVVRSSVDVVFSDLAARFGTPRSVAGLEVPFAILGLGKLGGAALGYASDIELLFVYGDNGKTDGAEQMDNGVFFDRLVREVNRFIETKREGIFRLDLRLRPHGNAGPLATSLENFCRYYGEGGPAHSYERLALVRMRAIGGDKELGARLERLRDEMVYASHSIDLGELQDLRKKQFQEKASGKRMNAKFSPGALVDLEYGIQILQVVNGKDVRAMRTPLLHEALAILGEAGVLLPEEAGRLVADYHFLRKLINGMRMLRGSARDLFLPETGSEEYRHLARRMGYRRGSPLEPAEQLRIDFEAHTASIRAFAERHFGRESLPGPMSGTVADLVLSPSISKELRRKILSDAGFEDPEKAYVNLMSLAGKGSRQETFARLAVLAFDMLGHQPDPDMALNNWERFARVLPSPEFHFGLMLSQPLRLEILMGIFSGSQFLTDTLVRNPEFFEWVTIPEILRKVRKKEEIAGDLKGPETGSQDERRWLNRLRRLRRREILRIGTRDICLGVSTREVVRELSSVADAMIHVALERIWQELRKKDRTIEKEGLERGFCVMAMGKLGGNELNYSSDIDLLGLWQRAGAPDGGGTGRTFYKELYAQVMERLRLDLSSHTEEGYAYRVDLRLRPFGRSGELVPEFSALENYYHYGASMWEVQAALKMRPVAGNLQLGYQFLEKIRPVVTAPRPGKEIAASIERMRQMSVKHSAGRLGSRINVKTGIGGLRDVEFLVQGLQLFHSQDHPSLLQGNTLLAIEALCENGFLSESTSLELKDDYLFLRKIEHCLQIMEDLQVHALPKGTGELAALAKRVLGHGADREGFLEKLNACTERIRSLYESHLLRHLILKA